MPKALNSILMVLVLSIFIVGCSSTSKVKVHGFLQDKERVDQDVAGNSGFLQGNNSTENQGPKRTRKVFVLEVTKTPKEIVENIPSVKTVSESQIQNTVDESRQENSKSESVRQRISLPSFEDDHKETAAENSVTVAESEYTIEKDDTLQKISKKVYGSYGKWIKIYEANKEVLKDPNHIKPGLKIKIPSSN